MRDHIEVLNDLLMLDHDAVKAYTAAIEHVDIAFAREKLIGFRADHQSHIRGLVALIMRLGGSPKDHVDMKGPLIAAVTLLRSLMGNAQALQVMKSNEELTSRKYSEALAEALPAEAMELVAANRDDELRHLAWLELVIRQRIWDSASEAHP